MILTILTLAVCVSASIVHVIVALLVSRATRSQVRVAVVAVSMGIHSQYMDLAVFYWQKNRSDAIQWVMDSVSSRFRAALIEEMGEAEYRVYLGGIYDRTERR